MLPGVVAWLLRRVLPADWREDIIRDVEEAYGIRSGTSPVRAWLWAWAQVPVFAVRFIGPRLRDLVTDVPVTSLDLRLAVRSARRHWGLSLLTIVAIAFGIGATTAGFGLIAGAFFSPLPFPGGDRIHEVVDYNTTRSIALWMSGEEYVRRRDVLTSFEFFGAYQSRAVVLGTERRVIARFITPEILAMTETPPLMGRLPEAADALAGAEPVVVLPYDLWQSALGGEAGVIGSRVEIAGVDRTVIAVMPPDFAFPWGYEIWIPMDPRGMTDRVQVIGKLREGVNAEAARAELAVVARPDPRQVQSPDDVIRPLVTPLNRPVTGDAQLLFLAAPLGALVLLLVVMATNVATVVLARNAARSGELAVRVAMGASRRRVIGLLVLEVGVTVIVAAAAGLVLAQTGLRLLENWITDLPFWIDLSVDLRVVAFTMALAALATAVAGLVPALRTTKGSLHDNLKDGGRGTSVVRFGRATDAIIISELGISVGFLAAAAILGQSLLSFGFARYGLPSEETLVAQVYFGQPPELADPDVFHSPEERATIWDAFFADATRQRARLLDRTLELPGVRTAAVGSRFPGDESETAFIEVENGGRGSPRRAELAAVGEGYFELLGAAPLQGRDFSAAERTGEIRVALVDQPFIDAHLGGGNAIGRRIRLASDANSGDASAQPWLEIVGVMPDLGLAVGDPARGGTVYTPIAPTNILWLGIRGDGSPWRWTPGLIEAAREVDPAIRVQGTQTLEDMMMVPVTLYRALGIGFLVLGGIALLLSAASLHAVTASAVTRRTREMGIRRALGAPSGTLVVSTVRRAAIQLGAGILLGAGIAFGLLQLAAIFPWRLGPGNPAVLAAVPLVLGLALLLALAGPLARALSIRPADALRYE